MICLGILKTKSEMHFRLSRPGVLNRGPSGPPGAHGTLRGAMGAKSNFGEPNFGEQVVIARIVHKGNNEHNFFCLWLLLSFMWEIRKIYLYTIRVFSLIMQRRFMRSDTYVFSYIEKVYYKI